MTSPLIVQDFTIVQGDTWAIVMPLVFLASGTPLPLLGFTADFSIRQNYGDPVPMFSMTTSAPSANGSTIAIVIPPGGSVLSAIQWNVVPADTLFSAAPPLVGNRQARYFYTCRMFSPSPTTTTTVAVGTLFIWSKS